MIGKSTTKAKVMLAGALHGRNYAIKVFLLHCTLNGIDAVRRGTPLKIILVVHVSSRQQFMVAITS